MSVHAVCNQPILEAEIPHILAKLQLECTHIGGVYALTNTPDAPHMGMYNEGMFEITRVESIPFTDKTSNTTFFSTELELPFRDVNKSNAYLILQMINRNEIIIARYGTTEAGSGIYDVYFFDPQTPIHSLHNLPEALAFIHEKLCTKTVDPNLLQWINDERQKHIQALHYLDTLRALLI